MKTMLNREKPRCTREQAQALLEALLENYRMLAQQERELVRGTLGQVSMGEAEPAGAHQEFAAATR